MVKDKQLKKQLIRTSIIMVIAMTVLGGAAAFVYTTATDVEAELRTVKSKLSSTERDITAREEKAKLAQEYLELYHSIQAEKDGDAVAALQREVAQAWALEAGKQMHLVSLEGAFEPVKPVAAEAFKKDTLEGISSKASLKFGAMTDEHVFRFVKAVESYFPGYVKFESMKLEKMGEINDAVLRQIGGGGEPALVEGELVFHWLGVREVSEDNAQADAGAANARRR